MGGCQIELLTTRDSFSEAFLPLPLFFSPSSVKLKVGGEEIELTGESIAVKVNTTKVSIDEYTPSVIEPSFGIGRILYSLLEHSFWTREADEQRAVLSFKPLIAPIKCLVAPLSNKTEFDPLVEEIGENRVLLSLCLFTFGC